MKLIQKHLKTTDHFRQIFTNPQNPPKMAQKLSQTLKIPNSPTQFTKTFPTYPKQSPWHISSDLSLHSYTWPSVQQTKGVLINFNALNAHTGLSGHMGQMLSYNGITTVGFDYPNFGKSPSPHPGHIESIEGLVQISEKFVQKIKKQYQNVPIYLFGVSMGALISFEISLRNNIQFDGCIFVNPAFQDNPLNNPFLKKVMIGLGKHLPKMRTIKPLKSNSTNLSLTKYRLQDRYLYTDKVWTSTTAILLQHMRSVSTVENFNKFDKDFFCIQGEIDKVVNGFKVFQLERGARGRIKDVVVVEGLWHSLWFDQGADEVIEGVRDWILERIEEKKQKQGEENKQKERKSEGK